MLWLVKSFKLGALGLGRSNGMGARTLRRASTQAHNASLRIPIVSLRTEHSTSMAQPAGMGQGLVHLSISTLRTNVKCTPSDRCMPEQSCHMRAAYCKTREWQN